MPPIGVSLSGEALSAADEGLIRRVRRRTPCIPDQVTGKYRPPASAFEPRLPQTQPRAARFDAYLSVNVESSLLLEGLQLDWDCDRKQFYAVRLPVSACHTQSLRVTWEPVIGRNGDPNTSNPHHGAIHDVVEMFSADRDQYEFVITFLAKASELLPAFLR